MAIYYSAARNAFYPEAYRDNYINSVAGWPDDALAVGEGVYQYLIQRVTEGKIIVADDNGYPVLADRPAPTPEQLMAQAEDERKRLLTLAAEKIAPLQDAADLDMASDEERAALTAWRKYRVLLNRVDTSATEITWPEVPENVA